MPRKTKDLNDRLRRAVKKGEIEGLVRKLVSIESHCDVPTREKEVAEFLKDFIDGEGISVKLRKVEKDRPNVIATIRGTTGAGRSLMLNGHTDTVPAYQMDMKPFAPKVAGGRLYGRGALDMKGGLGAMAMSLVAVDRARIDLQSDLVLAAVVGEEMRSEGTEDIVVRGPKTDVAIVGEPTDLEIQPSHRGLEWLEVHITGRAAHGGQADRGVNAITMAARFINALEEELMPKLQSRRSGSTLPPTLNIGVIKGGQQPSSVADKCVVCIDRRWTPEESLDMVFEDIYDVFDSVKRDHPRFKAELKRDTANMKTMTHVPNLVEKSHPIVRTLQSSIAQETGKRAKVTTFWGWTDAALLTHFAKTPAVVFGPGGAGAHSKTEYVKTNDLCTCTNVYAATAIGMCKVDA
jgi:acetylornithine deacetylase/succinyl-diaminopimelate desuccinylase family protein